MKRLLRSLGRRISVTSFQPCSQDRGSGWHRAAPAASRNARSRTHARHGAAPGRNSRSGHGLTLKTPPDHAASVLSAVPTSARCRSNGSSAVLDPRQPQAHQQQPQGRQPAQPMHQPAPGRALALAGGQHPAPGGGRQQRNGKGERVEFADEPRCKLDHARLASRAGQPATMALQPIHTQQAEKLKVATPNQSKALAPPRQRRYTPGAARSASGGSSSKARNCCGRRR